MEELIIGLASIFVVVFLIVATGGLLYVAVIGGLEVWDTLGREWRDRRKPSGYDDDDDD